MSGQHAAFVGNTVNMYTIFVHVLYIDTQCIKMLVMLLYMYTCNYYLLNLCRQYVYICKIIITILKSLLFLFIHNVKNPFHP